MKTFNDLDDAQLTLLHERAHNSVLDGSSSLIRVPNTGVCVVVCGPLSTVFQPDGQIDTFCQLHHAPLCNLFELVDMCRTWGLPY